ncbi:antibiotic hydrolase, partial [Escherichia coli]|nr:antibiotic hydrolase [Escherichia coli]
ATFDGQVDHDWLTFRLKFFARWLKGELQEDDPLPVRIFVMGGGSGRRTAGGQLDHGGHWIAAAEWPPADTRPLTLYPTPGMWLAEA